MVAGGDRFDSRLETIQELVVHPALRQYPLSRDTDLSGVGEARHGGGGSHLVQVGVVHDDQGSVGAQLHGDFLHPGYPADVVAHFVTPGEGNLADPLVPAQYIAHFRSGTGQAGYGLGRHTGLQQDLHQLEGGKGCVTGRFHDHGVSGGQGRSHLVADQMKGKVKGCDGSDYATGHPQGEAHFPGSSWSCVQGKNFAGESFGLFTGEVNDFGCAGRLETGLGQDLSFFAADGPGKVLGAFQHEIRRLAQHLGSIIGRDFRHDLRPFHRTGQCLIHITRSGRRDRVDD